MSRAKLAIIGAIASTGIGGALLFNPAMAQEYPARAVRLLIPFAPGGTTDVFARKYAERMSREGVQMIPENKAGASGAIAAAEVARATPDGHTLFFATSSTVAILPLMDQKTPYDIDKDFAHISLIGITSHLISMNPNFPAKSLSELVTLLKASPGKYSYGHSGVGGPTHLAGELFKSLAGVNIIDVPYKGSAPGAADVAGGQVQLMFDAIAPHLPHLKSGRTKVLAAISPARLPIAPDAPTMSELGFAQVAASIWYGMMAPANTPKALITKLNAEANKALAMPEVKERLSGAGIDVGGGSPEDYAKFVRDELAKWGPVVKASGAKLD